MEVRDNLPTNSTINYLSQLIFRLGSPQIAAKCLPTAHHMRCPSYVWHVAAVCCSSRGQNGKASRGERQFQWFTSQRPFQPQPVAIILVFVLPHLCHSVAGRYSQIAPSSMTFSVIGRQAPWWGSLSCGLSENLEWGEISRSVVLAGIFQAFCVGYVTAF